MAAFWLPQVSSSFSRMQCSSASAPSSSSGLTLRSFTRTCRIAATARRSSAKASCCLFISSTLFCCSSYRLLASSSFCRFSSSILLRWSSMRFLFNSSCCRLASSICSRCWSAWPLTGRCPPFMPLPGPWPFPGTADCTGPRRALIRKFGSTPPSYGTFHPVVGGVCEDRLGWKPQTTSLPIFGDSHHPEEPTPSRSSQK
mmetsp:Transcript_69130/g.191314  ORF Transcript_69130/g.191314 Transcript_69130/m.191314 type:complete len:200 (-) Transcript_69130:309-908(-)